MKINGTKLSGPNIDYVVFPRPGGEIVFKITAVLDYKLFENLVPEPKPGVMTLPGGATVPNPSDQFYRDQLKDYNSKRWDFMIVSSLKDSPGLEWEKVILTNPDSWANYDEEMKESGFTQNEINYLVLRITIVNSLNEEKLEQARKDFLALNQVAV